MNAIFIAGKNLKKVREAFAIVENNGQVKSVMFLMASTHALSQKALTPIFNGCSKPVFGGVFPALVFEGKQEQVGILLIPLDVKVEYTIVSLLDSKEAQFAAINDFFQPSSSVKGTVFLSYDNAGNLPSNFVSSTYNYFGTDVHYFGGGAGSPDFKPSSSIITNKGFHKNAGIIAHFTEEKQMGAAHGLSSISEPLKVTETKNNQIISLNWKPAFMVYKEIAERFSGKKVIKKNYFEYVNAYPLGVLSLDGQPLVRDISKLTGEGISTQTSVSEGEHVVVIDANSDQDLAASKQARKKAFPWAANMAKNAFCWVSYSRHQLIGETANQELAQLQGAGKLHGVYTLGEILNTGESILEIANKTVGVVKW